MKGLPVFMNEHVECDGCALRKQHRNEFLMRIDKWKKYFLELVHTNVCDPIQIKSLRRASYFFIFINVLNTLKSLEIWLKNIYR